MPRTERHPARRGALLGGERSGKTTLAQALAAQSVPSLGVPCLGVAGSVPERVAAVLQYRAVSVSERRKVCSP